MADWLRDFGSIYKIKPKNEKDFSLEELQFYVKGNIEIISLGKSKIMVLNEEGKLMGLPKNDVATSMALDAGINDVIVGDVVVCDTKEVK